MATLAYYLVPTTYNMQTFMNVHFFAQAIFHVVQINLHICFESCSFPSEGASFTMDVDGKCLSYQLFADLVQERLRMWHQQSQGNFHWRPCVHALCYSLLSIVQNHLFHDCMFCFHCMVPLLPGWFDRSIPIYRTCSKLKHSPWMQRR